MISGFQKMSCLLRGQRPSKSRSSKNDNYVIAVKMQLLLRAAVCGLVRYMFCLHYSTIPTLNIVIPTKENPSDSELPKQSHPYCTAVIICYAFLNIKLLCSRLVCLEVRGHRKAITVCRQYRCDFFI